MKKYFSEKQHFTQIWLWILLLGIFFLSVFDGFRISEATSLWEVIWPFNTGDYLLFAVILLFLLMSLKTELRTDGVYFRFFPFHWSLQRIHWEDLEKAEVRKYKPLWEFGGWGLRWSWNGTAYNIKGNQGLQLVLKNGKRILIGTQKPEEMRKSLEKLKSTQS